jgi:hypothetical protein
MTKTKKQDDLAPSMTKLMQTLQDASRQTMPGFGAGWMEAMTQMGTEMLEFTAARIKEDAQVQHDLMQAKGIVEVQQIQTQFFQKAMEDYSAESAKLMEMGKSFAPKDETNTLPI